jgi:hypothetical protein
MSSMISTAGVTRAIRPKFRASFVDSHGTSIEVIPVKGSNCGFGFRSLRHFDKCHAAWLTSVPVFNEGDAFHSTMCSEELSQLLFCGRYIKVANKNVRHELI